MVLGVACAGAQRESPEPLTTTTVAVPTQAQPGPQDSPDPEPSGPRPSDVRQIVQGHYHGCVLRFDGRVACWHNHQWSERDGEPSDPWLIERLPAVVSIDMGAYVACGRTADGAVYCWSAQRTPEPETPGIPLHAMRLDIPPTRSFDMGAYRGCAVLTDGRLACWGAMDHSVATQFEDAAVLPKATHKVGVVLDHEFGVLCAIEMRRTVCRRLVGDSEPRTFSRSAAEDLGLGSFHGCMRSKRTVLCFGLGSSPQLGADREQNDYWLPVVVSEAEGAVSLAVGREHTCVVREDRRVLCWGDNGYGQVSPSVKDRLVPRAIEVGTAPPGWRLTAHETLTCLSSDTGEHRCWGACARLPDLPRVSCESNRPDGGLGIAPPPELPPATVTPSPAPTAPPSLPPSSRPR